MAILGTFLRFWVERIAIWLFVNLVLTPRGSTHRFGRKGRNHPPISLLSNHFSRPGGYQKVVSIMQKLNLGFVEGNREKFLKHWPYNSKSITCWEREFWRDKELLSFLVYFCQTFIIKKQRYGRKGKTKKGSPESSPTFCLLCPERLISCCRFCNLR